MVSMPLEPKVSSMCMGMGNAPCTLQGGTLRYKRKSSSSSHVNGIDAIGIQDGTGISVLRAASALSKVARRHYGSYD